MLQIAERLAELAVYVFAPLLFCFQSMAELSVFFLHGDEEVEAEDEANSRQSVVPERMEYPDHLTFHSFNGSLAAQL